MIRQGASDKRDALVCFLDLSIDASALMVDIDPDIGSFAMMAVLVAAEKLGMSDGAAYALRDSALAEIRKRRADDEQ
jgi:hypothetical protein